MPASASESTAMTTSNTKSSSKARTRFPDIPERPPDDMTGARAIHLNGNSHSLRVHYGDRPNAVVDGEHYISRITARDMTGIVYPGLLIAFDANPGGPGTEQPLRHIRAGQAAGLRTGSRLPQSAQPTGPQSGTLTPSWRYSTGVLERCHLWYRIVSLRTTANVCFKLFLSAF